MGKWHEIVGESQTGGKPFGCMATVAFGILAVLGALVMVVA